MCARQRSNFLLLAQEKVTKEKGTLLAGRPRVDCSALLGLWGTRRTHFAACGRCVQTGGAKSEDEARFACRPKALRCSTAHQGAQEKARLRHRVTPRCASARSEIKPRAARPAGVVSPFGRAEQHRALRGARSAHQPLTSGGCQSAAAVRRVASSARPAKTEQRKAALATRGPRRQGRFLCPLSLSIQRKGVGRRAEHPARPHAVNKITNAKRHKANHPELPPPRE
jgi:hypothetical protein